MNNFKELYQHGVNLGGWISQYGDRSLGDPHFDTFITEWDIARIAGFGLDHLRLPVDYMIFERDGNPCVYDEAGLGYIDRCLGWCKAHGLNLVLDLHHAPGFSFHTLADNRLFADAVMQERMIRIWENFARRYRGEGANLCFELMNEIVEPDSSRWNALAERLVARIRAIDGERVILIGGNNYNAVSELKNIALIPDDSNIVYNFHFYEPMLFTHQLARWNRMNMDYGLQPAYPSIFPGVAEFLQRHPEYESLRRFDGLYVDIEWMREGLQPALDFIKSAGKTVYCGEYGVIDHADPLSRRNWHRDFNRLMEEYGIGRAAWSYKMMGFRFVGRDGKVADEELVRIIAGRG